SCFGTGTLACAFIVPDDPVAMRQVLLGLGDPFIEGEPIVLDVEDRPGGLADVAERFASAGVSILGTMCVGQRPGFIEMAFTVDDEAKARAALPDMQRDLAGTIA
ncbi:MAG TPA: ACT domain-containing protein, partial [Candidatus Acidoferrales bacterium]|nr:ACT domain-containing protein [Candidatus Acidoferrales bacterium]